MAILSRTKSASDQAPAYLAVPSFIIQPHVNEATHALADTLNREHAAAVEEYQGAVDKKAALNAEYRRIDRVGSVTMAGITYRSGETDAAAEMAKKLKSSQDAAAKASAHNDKLRAKQDALQLEANAIAVKMRMLKDLWNTVSIAAHAPLLFDAAAILLTRSPGEQILFLNVLTKGARFKFGSPGEYESADVRLLGALIDGGSKVELVK